MPQLPRARCFPNFGISERGKWGRDPERILPAHPGLSCRHPFPGNLFLPLLPLPCLSFPSPACSLGHSGGAPPQIPFWGETEARGDAAAGGGFVPAQGGFGGAGAGLAPIRRALNPRAPLPAGSAASCSQPGGPQTPPGAAAGAGTARNALGMFIGIVASVVWGFVPKRRLEVGVRWGGNGGRNGGTWMKLLFLKQEKIIMIPRGLLGVHAGIIGGPPRGLLGGPRGDYWGVPTSPPEPSDERGGPQTRLR